ncbi:MAG: hypothetical protein M3151_03765 [Actinomycetota bacterium]|nr:hypothetical protein [Actinomycetota bacterium]
MNRRTAALLAWSSWALTVALVPVGLTFCILALSASLPPGRGPMLPFVVVVDVLLLAYVTVGVLIVNRRPDNKIGWIFCAVGLALALASAASGYADYGLYGDGGALPAPELAAWLSIWLNIVVLVVAPCLLFLLFPDGRPPSARWRPVVWLVALAGATIFFMLAFSPGELDQYTYPGLRNPLGIEGKVGALLADVEGPGNAIVPIAVLVSISSTVIRFRRSGGRERLQLKWVAYAAALMAASFLVSFVLPEAVPRVVQDAVFFLGVAAFAAIPIAAGIAILKHRLYGIDVLINRTLVYGLLTLSLAVIYVGGIALIQGLFRALTGQETELAVVASTLAIAALFGPLRRRVQGFIDRRFYRKKYDAAKTLESFSDRLRDETDLEILSEDLVGVVRETVQPAHARLWLRSPGRIEEDAR